ncbi:MAG: hypothetical protein ACE5IB_05210 [Candidatus Geothermarchaeales archaeon]
MKLITRTVGTVFLIVAFSSFVMASGVVVRDLGGGSSASGPEHIGRLDPSTGELVMEAQVLTGYMFCNTHDLVVRMDEADYPFRVVIEGVDSEWRLEREGRGTLLLNPKPPLAGLYRVRIIGLEERQMDLSLTWISASYFQTGEVEECVVLPLLTIAGVSAPLGVLLQAAPYIRGKRNE